MWGSETAGTYCLIDIIVPRGGGPVPHRHASDGHVRLVVTVLGSGNPQVVVEPSGDAGQ
jgi:hypothetical protein